MKKTVIFITLLYCMSLSALSLPAYSQNATYPGNMTFQNTNLTGTELPGKYKKEPGAVTSGASNTDVDTQSKQNDVSLKRSIEANTKYTNAIGANNLIQSNHSEANSQAQPAQLFNFKDNLFGGEIIYSEYYMKADAIDPQKQTSNMTYYPGMRGPNQLIVYTPAYGYSTGTNEFGTEAIVVNNMVVALNGADSAIPRNGFVISGQGRAKTRIQKNIKIGSKVYIDYANSSVSVFYTPESLMFAAKEKYKEVNNLLSYYKSTEHGYNGAKAIENLNVSEEEIKKAEKKPEKAQEYIETAMEHLDKAMKNILPYKRDELKGVWLRPVEQSPEEIDKTVARIHSSGITDIFLETYFHGKTIYRSNHLLSYGVTPQRGEFAGFDPLEAWIKSAHKRNMKVHIWFETFYVGNENPQYNPYHVLNRYPEWSNKRLSSYNSETPVSSPSEHNGYFLDPANPMVRKYLLGLINEIITTYHPDGINLDYIRYPQTVDTSYSGYTSSNWGYTPYARSEFMSIYNIDPIELSYGSAEWDMWCAYRQNKITEFVADVNRLTSANKIMLTAVVFPELRKCRYTKMQNWQIWSLRNYVDGLTPLILSSDVNTAVRLLRDFINNTNSYTKIYPGLFVTFMGGSFDELLMQIQKSRELQTKGNILFDYAHLEDRYIDALSTRVYNRAYENKDAKAKNQYPVISGNVKGKKQKRNGEK